MAIAFTTGCTSDGDGLGRMRMGASNFEICFLEHLHPLPGHKCGPWPDSMHRRARQSAQRTVAVRRLMQRRGPACACRCKQSISPTVMRKLVIAMRAFFAGQIHDACRSARRPASSRPAWLGSLPRFGRAQCGGCFVKRKATALDAWMVSAGSLDPERGKTVP